MPLRAGDFESPASAIPPLRLGATMIAARAFESNRFARVPLQRRSTEGTMDCAGRSLGGTFRLPPWRRPSS
jgi:hypothetical protein